MKSKLGEQVAFSDPQYRPDRCYEKKGPTFSFGNHSGSVIICNSALSADGSKPEASLNVTGFDDKARRVSSVTACGCGGCVWHGDALPPIRRATK